MSSSSTLDRDAQLLNVGQQCSAPSCLLVDFLPFKCQHCAHSFCGEHFLPESHKCDKFDASKHNRVAPSCPLCNTPVAVPPGQDPNIRMERHINSECSVMTGKSGKASSSPVCANLKCKKVLFAPIRCDKCNQQFCPQHRFPTSHTCTDQKIPAVKPSQPIRPAAATAAAMSAIKRAMASTQASSPASQASISSHASTQTSARNSTQTAVPTSRSGATSSTSRSNPFSAVDRHLPALVTTPSNASDDTTNDPPARCSPKSTSSSNAFVDPLSFIPRSIFASA